MLNDSEEYRDTVDAGYELAKNISKLHIDSSPQLMSSTVGSPILSSVASNTLTLENDTASEQEALPNDLYELLPIEEDIDQAMWAPVKNISGDNSSFFIHRDLFQKGILAIRKCEVGDEPLLEVNGNSFYIKSFNSLLYRNFRVCTKGEFLDDQKSTIKLVLVDDLPVKGQLKQHEIYIQQRGAQLSYAILLDKTRKAGVLQDLVVTQQIDQEFLEQSKLDILNYIYKQGDLKNAYLAKTETLLKELTKHLECQPDTKDINNIIVNTNRREEIFFPLILRDTDYELGFYVYPWLSDYEQHDAKYFQFSGFKRFVTAGCIAGTTIKAGDVHGWKCNFIKHNLPFNKEQQICEITLDNLTSCYEQTWFNEFDKLLLLVDQLTEQGAKKEIYYHLPWYDYILFGIELFNDNKITLPALNKFLEIIFDKKEEHVNKIKHKCTERGIECTIASPFENLFNYNHLEIIKRNRAYSKSADFPLAKAALKCLDIVPKEPAVNAEAKQLYAPDQLINIILTKLKTNQFNKEQQQIWGDIIEAVLQDPKQTKITNVDDLFKIANAVMVAVASKGQEDYKVCGLHTISEKSIAVSYSTLRTLLKKVAEETGQLRSYPAVFNLAVMEPALGYNHSSFINHASNGLMFYFPGYQDVFHDLIKDKQVLSFMHRNIADATKHRETTSLEVVLPYLKPLI